MIGRSNDKGCSMSYSSVLKMLKKMSILLCYYGTHCIYFIRRCKAFAKIVIRYEENRVGGRTHYGGNRRAYTRWWALLLMNLFFITEHHRSFVAWEPIRRQTSFRLLEWYCRPYRLISDLVVPVLFIFKAKDETARDINTAPITLNSRKNNWNNTLNTRRLNDQRPKHNRDIYRMEIK